MSGRFSAVVLTSSITVGLVAGALALTPSACAIYDESLLTPDAAAPDVVAPLDAGPDVADPCAHALPSPPPAADDGSATLDLVFALDSLQLVQSNRPLGLDIDGVCTCPGPEACLPATSPAVAHCDDVNGRDNSGGAMLATFASAADNFSEARVNTRLREGAYSLLIRLRGYNGGANDTQVTVIAYKSRGTEGADDAGVSPPPKYDGTDRWTIDPSSIIGGTTSAGTDCDNGNVQCIGLSVDDKAYVTDHVLVSHIDIVLPIGAGSELELQRATVTARLVPKGTAFALEEGNMAGRWRADKVLATVANSIAPGGSGPICNDLTTYASLKKIICGAADTPSDPATAKGDVACDALSLGMGFTASPAHMAKITSRDVSPPACGVTWTDSCTKR